MKLRKVLYALVLVPSLLWARGAQSFFSMLDFHGGLNSYYSSLTIADNEVQSALNVYFSKDNSVSKRGGFNLYAATTAVSYNGMVQYTDSNNIAWLITIGSDKIRASRGNGSFSVVIATVPPFSTSLVSYCTAMGNVYFVDQIQGVYFWNGTSTSYVSGSPKGSLICQFHGRVWVAGIAIPSQNFLYGSKYLDGTIWTTGPLATDPVQFQVGLNDNYDGITGFFPAYNDTLYLFKNLSINSLQGFDQTDFTIRTLTNEAGCIDEGSIQPFRSYITFMSQRGIELFNGYTTVRVSKKIKNLTDPASNSSFSQRSWEQSTAADFAVSTVTPAGYADKSAPIKFLFPDSFATLRDGTGGTLNVWTAYNSGSASGSVSVSANSLNLNNNGGTLGYINEKTTNALADFQQGTTYHFVINHIPAETVSLSKFSLVLSSVSYSTPGGVNPNALSSAFGFTFIATTSGFGYYASWGDGIDFPTIHPSPDIAFPMTVDIAVATTTWQIRINGVLYDKAAHTWPHNQVYAYLSYFRGTAGASTCRVTNFGVAPMKLNFTSQAFKIGSDINSWGNFNVVSDAGGGGAFTYSVCSSSNSNMVPSTCTAQTPNAIIATSTNAYVQVLSTITTSNVTDTTNLTSFIVNWNEGVRRPRMASLFYDDRYWLSLTTNTADTANDATIVMSLDNTDSFPVFTLWDVQAGAYCLYKNLPYHADSQATGNVFQDNQGYSDNGQAISAYFQTKDFVPPNTSGPDPGIISDDFFDTFYLVADALGSYQINLAYFLDRSAISNPLDTIMQNEQIGMINQKVPFPINTTNQVFGKTISFKFSNAVVDQPMNVYGGVVSYHERPAP